MTPGSSPFLALFDRMYAPYLGMRRHTFRKVFELLEEHRKHSYLIVETGTVHNPLPHGAYEGNSQGYSTLLFDQFVNVHGGSVFSIDVSPEHCERARGWVGARTHVVCHESCTFLADFRPPTSIDCLFLDSLDIDWGDPHPSALHHMHELCAILPRLSERCIVVVDDNVGAVGKGGYVSDVMKRLGAAPLFDDYQRGWVLTGPPTPIRALGMYDEEEADFVGAFAEPRWFRYVRVGYDARMLELLPDGQIGVGRARCEERWFPEHLGDGRIGLVLVGQGQVTCRLSPGPGGVLRGRWAVHERMPIELWPVDHSPARADLEILVPGHYWLHRGADGPWPLELLPQGDVGWGRASGLHTWSLEPVGRLCLEAAGQAAAVLVRGEDGAFRAEAPPVLLEPAPAPDASVLAERALLARTRLFHFTRGEDGWLLELLPDGVIGRGRAPAELQWNIEAMPQCLQFVLYGAHGPTCRLTPAEDGTWLRTSLQEGAEPVRMEPAVHARGSYLLTYFTACLPRQGIRRIVELGSFDGSDAVDLQRYFAAEVYSFECNPDILPTCTTRLAKHPGITLIARAVGDMDGSVPFYRVINGNAAASSQFRAQPSYPYERYIQAPCEVEMVRLETWALQAEITSVDLVCIDVQGGCLRALQGMGPLLDSVRFIIAELGTRAIYEGESLAPETIAFLESRGFHLLRWINQWGVTPCGHQVDAPRFSPLYAAEESWFGDYLFVRHTPAEAAVATELTAQRRWRYERVGFDMRVLELLPGGQIGAGAARCERHWMLQERACGRVDLLLLGHEMVTCLLTLTRDGNLFTGRWASHERMPVVLTPA